MMTHGSKFFLGLAAFLFVLAAVYGGASAAHHIGMDTFTGVTTLGYKGRVGDHLGYTILAGAAITSLFLGVTVVALRDADPEAGAEVIGADTVPEAPAPASPSYWPVVAAFSIGSLVLGLAVGPALFVIGAVGLAVVTVEWAVKTWADRATGDPEVNRSIRNRMMYPIEIPAIAVLGIAVFVLSISRVLLALPKGGAYVIFGVVPALVLAVGWLIAVRPRVNPSLVAALLLVGAVALLAGGVYGAVHGERKFGEEHSTEGGLGHLGPPAEKVLPVHR